MKKVFLLAPALLLMLQLAASSQWGGSACFVPAQSSPVGGTLQWRTWPDTPNLAYLYRGPNHLGTWIAEKQKYRPLLDYDRGIWGAETDTAPIPPPSHLVKPSAQAKLKDFQLHGVEHKGIAKHGKVSINGVTVAEGDGKTFSGEAHLEDDSQKLWLSIWAKDPAKRALVLADLQKDPEIWKWVQERCKVWAGDAATPGHFSTVDREGKPLYAIDGEPTISLQAPDGTELWHDAGYTQGPASLQALRKRDPTYSPDKTPGPKSPAGSTDDYGTTVLLGAAGIGLLLLFQKRKEE